MFFVLVPAAFAEVGGRHVDDRGGLLFQVFLDIAIDLGVDDLVPLKQFVQQL